jgi:hypothetical protein
MRQRKKEMDALIKLLEQPAESVDDLADDVWELIDNARRGREVYAIGVNYKGVGQFLFGPYESEAMARKDVEGRGNIRGLGTEDNGKIFKVLVPTDIFPKDEQIDMFDLR